MQNDCASGASTPRLAIKEEAKLQAAMEKATSWPRESTSSRRHASLVRISMGLTKVHAENASLRFVLDAEENLHGSVCARIRAVRQYVTGPLIHVFSLCYEASGSHHHLGEQLVSH